MDYGLGFLLLFFEVEYLIVTYRIKERNINLNNFPQNS
jgi:hypothetical protein